MKLFRFAVMAMAVLLAAFESASHAQSDPQIFGNGTETTTRYNPGNESVSVYANCFVNTLGGTQMRVNSLSVGIRRLGTVDVPAPPVTVEVSLNEMTWNGTAFGLGPTVATFTADLAESVTTQTDIVSQTWGDADPSLRPVLNLETQSNSNNNYGGYWVGVRFTGPNAANGLNGWRVVNAPAIGASINGFGLFNYQNSGAFQAFYNFGTDAATGLQNPARFLVNTSGAITDPSIVFGAATETGTRYNPGPTITAYGNCFVAAQPGEVLRPKKISVGIRRFGSTTAPAPAVDVEVSIVEMTFDGTNYGIGQSVASQTFALAASISAKTDRLNLNFTDPATRPTIALETTSTAGFGGYWIAIRFAGPNAADTLNGIRVVNAPAYGTSVNGFGLFNWQNNGVFQAWFNFGNDATTGVQNPARFLIDTYGFIESPTLPCPGDLNGDGSVGASDLALLLSAWGPCAGCGADINGDGTVGAADLALTLSAWGSCP